MLLAPAARPILTKFANITRILLIPNCTRQRMITCNKIIRALVVLYLS